MSAWRAQLIVVAFNEWTEQAVLEPTDVYGTAYLEALRSVLQRHGQYHYKGLTGLWKEVRSEGATPAPQLTECARSGFQRGVRTTPPWTASRGLMKG